MENHFHAIQIILEISHHITLVTEVDHLNKEIDEISHKTDIVDQLVEITLHDRTQTQHNLFLDPVPNQTQGIDTIPTTDHESHHTTEIKTIQTIETEVTQIIEIRIIQTIDHEKIHTKDQAIRNQMTTTKLITKKITKPKLNL